MGTFYQYSKLALPVFIGQAFVLGGLLVAQEENGEPVLELPQVATEDSAEPVYELEDFTVVAERYGEVGDFALLSVQVLETAELQRQLQATLGETLAWEPGLSASYFGPGASRPIVRGLGDYRVRMLVDDIGTLDVSDSSPDHGVPLEPLLIRRVDVHRGPDALLFGNAAIGGAINSQTRYLPESVPAEPVTGSTELRYETGSNARSVAAYGTARAGDFALQLTGARRRADDYKIPGNARSDEYEKEFNPEVFNPDTGLAEPVPNPSGTVPNTYIDTETASIGALWEPFAGRGRLGIAYSRYESSYGVPYQYGGGSSELFGDTGLEMRQSRLDLEAAFDLDLERLERVRFRLGHADYSHEETFTGRAKDAGKEFEDTMMWLDSVEARADLYHRLADGFEGVVGVHGFKRDMQASRLIGQPDLGQRAGNLFDTWNVGAFLVETWTYDVWTLRGGYRYERQHIEDLSQKEAFDFVRGSKDESHSLAFGVTWRDYQRWGLDEVALTLNFSRIERLPSETERYAFWKNPAIQRFVIGADNTGTPLEVERSNAVEFGFEAHKGDFSGRVNLYYYDFEDFVFLQDIKGAGNLALYVAKDAVFQGGETELTWRLYEEDANALRLKGMFDWVQGENRSDDTYLPRIPPMRIGSRVEYERGAWELGSELRYAFAQDRVQEETDVVQPELETDDYVELNLDAQYVWTLGYGELTMFARATNLLDVERRAHASFLKDVAPLPGRSLSLGMRYDF
ncbi:TonB-dependent receptor [Coraliomargarita akajimensis]|uniref:TonB-dependent receptor n=1 Tax=Coraliomargarita akajimensis (strain DSM 45221 / IAM 15411 / JCM 23193 / KCTC 12865 / 04OKA010-24) TaxID=583355 RepID=D5ELB1_CORAD|nr:TonB-dependent receptor [Coraliomargarita akajimensis]ADE55047.1 TonB-dependent receptor [Coraliomargarita akajimensis DSM 45221]